MPLVQISLDLHARTLYLSLSLLSAKLFTSFSLFCFFFYSIAKFSHAVVFFPSQLSSAHCHLHLRFTHAKNKKIYLFALSNFCTFSSPVVSFTLFFTAANHTVSNEVWLVLLVLLELLVLSHNCLLTPLYRKFSVCTCFPYLLGKYSNFLSLPRATIITIICDVFSSLWVFFSWKWEDNSIRFFFSRIHSALFG